MSVAHSAFALQEHLESLPKMKNIDKKALTPRILPNLTAHDENGKVEFRFGKAYTPAGHDFTKSFDVLQKAYFSKYQLISQHAIAFYQHLHYLAKSDQTFTLDQLAAQWRTGKAKICEWLDELENAELVERGKIVVQKGGQQNFYNIRTPYFEEDSINGSGAGAVRRRRQIAAAAEDLPETTLEREAPRLAEQIRTNAAKIRRDNLTKTERDEQKRNWSALFYDFGNNVKAALDFENIVFRAYKYLRDRADGQSDAAKWNTLDEIVKRQCKAQNITISNYLLTKAREIYLYYFRHDRARPQLADNPPTTHDTKTETASHTVATVQPTTEPTAKVTFETNTESVRNRLKLAANIVSNNLSKNGIYFAQGYKINSLADFVRFVRECLISGLSRLEVEQIAAPEFGERWQVIAEELNR